MAPGFNALAVKPKSKTFPGDAGGPQSNALMAGVAAPASAPPPQPAYPGLSPGARQAVAGQIYHAGGVVQPAPMMVAPAPGGTRVGPTLQGASVPPSTPAQVGPSGTMPPRGSPSDPMAQLRQTLGQVPPDELARLADNSDHHLQAISTLLKRPGIITRQHIDDAVTAAMDAKKATEEQVTAFLGRLPPLSNQGALRAALNDQRQQSAQIAVALHSEAQSRGLDLPSMVRGRS